MKPVVCIAGPTASGKSGFALELAKMLGGEIINADALQVYADLRILSARPTVQEQSGVPHHLFGYLSGSESYSAGKWQRAALPVILDCLARKRVPILTGGTGLYFRALLEGLADIPDVRAEVSARTQAFYDVQGISALRALAETLDPAACAKVLGDDSHRLMRIVNVAHSSGKPLSEWRAVTRPAIPKRFVRSAVLLPPRERLYAKINARFDEMMEGGAMDEVAAVASLPSLPDTLPMMKAIGLRQLLPIVRVGADPAVCIEDAKRETRRFAKRQSTWFRNQTPDWPKLVDENDQSTFATSLVGLTF